MSKKIIGIITFFILNLIIAQPVIAESRIDAKVTTSQFELKASEIVEITFSLENFQEIKKGINAIKGTIEYDKNIFDEIVQSDFLCQNNWENLKFNFQTKEFVAIRKVGTKIGENVVKITLKAKNSIEPTKTTIKIKDISTSEGKKDIFLNDAEITLNIVTEQQTIPTEPIKPATPDTPQQEGTIVNTTKPADVLAGNKVNTDINKNPDDIKDILEDNNDNLNDSNQNETPNESDKTTTIPDKTPNEKENPKIEKTTFKYSILLIFILIQLVAIITLYIKHKNKDKNRSINLSLMLLGIILTEFIGTTCAYAFDFAKKGELNGDSEINYADVSLLEMHLVNLKKLEDDNLENADMNMDGKITITDLTILIQKIEKTLEYEVEIPNIDPENAFPNKNEEVVIKFNADVSYGANIEKIVMNNQEYEVEKELNTSLYIVKLNAGITAGIKEYNITEVLLDNEKSVKINYTFKIDVLKDTPTIENYYVEENKDDSKLILHFHVIDNENSMESAHVEVLDENKNLITQETVVKGENRIEISVEEQKEYLANILLNYTLSSTEEDEEHSGVVSYEKELQLLVDYNFVISNIKTYKEAEETTIFSKEDKVKLVFESTNATKHIPKLVKVDGKEYEVEEENNKYAVTLDALSAIGSHTIKMEEITLSNGKKFTLDEINTITIQVNKRKPMVDDLETTEFTESNQLKVMFHLEDLDEAVTYVNIQVFDGNDNEIGNMKLPRNEVLSDGMVNKFFATQLTTKYKVKVSLSYNLTGNDADTITDELASEKMVEADPRITINSITPSSNYVEKGGVLKLNFDLESNKEEDITRILINNVNCIAVKLDNGNYEATLNVGHSSGIYPLTITKFTYSNDDVATTDKTINVEVLKDKPKISNFVQIDNLDTKEVTLRFDVLDEDNSLIGGKALLTLDENTIEKEIKKGYNELTFQVEPSRKYTLKINATYDLDSNTLPESQEEDNRVTDETLATKEVELIADYELNLSNIKTYNDNGETKYFNKSEPITIGFESTNTTSFEPVKCCEWYRVSSY